MTGLEAATPERRVALRVLRRVADGAYADRALLGEVLRAGLTDTQRAQAHRLAFGAVQRRRTLDAVIDRFVTRPRALEAGVRDVLRIGAFDVLYSDGVPVPVAVDQAVRLARGLQGSPSRNDARAGVVNAVMRQVAAQGAEVLAGFDDTTWSGAAIRHSVSDWIGQRLFDALGPDDARALLAASNEPAENALRWNPLRGSRAELEELLPAAARPDSSLPDAYVLDEPFGLEASEVWDRGLAIGQSRASMLPALALAPQPGQRVLDLCAAPGAKATQLAAISGNRAELVCVEARPARAESLRRLAERLGARIEVIEGDGRTVALEGVFDAALVDPPCTGLGVLSARPDARWRRRADDVAELVELQTALLERALGVVRPGGLVVYSTCTVLPEENEDVVARLSAQFEDLASRFPEFAHPGVPGALRSLPHVHGTDGFFVAGVRASAR